MPKKGSALLANEITILKSYVVKKPRGVLQEAVVAVHAATATVLLLIRRFG